MGPIRLADDAGASPVRAPHAVKESNPARSVLETNLLPEHGIEVVDMEGNAPSRTCLQGTAPAFRTRPLGCATGLEPAWHSFTASGLDSSSSHTVHASGIEPASPAHQARALPLSYAWVGRRGRI
jgi:hypothetical protein